MSFCLTVFYCMSAYAKVGLNSISMPINSESKPNSQFSSVKIIEGNWNFRVLPELSEIEMDLTTTCFILYMYLEIQVTAKIKETPT